MNAPRILALTGLVLLAPLAMASGETAAPAADAPVVEVSATGEQLVTVNTGNETVDAAANFAAKCAEKTAALKSCDQIGGLKAMGCRKLAEVKYKGVECPLQ